MAETHDRTWSKRLLIALALSIALHELAAGLFAYRPKPRPEAVTVTPQRVTFERRATPAPTPRATPAPTAPPAPVPVVSPAATRPAVVAPGRRAATPKRVLKGGRPVPHPAKALAPPRTIASRAPAPAAAAGQGIGMGAASGADAGGNAGSGTGNGSGTSGEGAGPDAAGTPCGYVDFTPFGAIHFVRGKYYVNVRAKIHFKDGHAETAPFPYPWVYNSEADNPWSDQNLKNDNFEAFAQFPPPGFDSANLPPAISKVLAHTEPGGRTLLQPCPGDPKALAS